jgi:ketosteroid isomerase-like protein
VTTQKGAGGKPESFWTRSVHFLEKRGGKWQVVSNTGHDMDDYMALDYLEQDWNDAVVNRDKAWFESNYASDFSSIGSSNGGLYNKAQDIDDTVNGKSKVTWAETSNMNISIDGKFAKVTGIFHIKGTDEAGKAMDRKIRYTDVWIKRDGRWQAWSSQGTDIK